MGTKKVKISAVKRAAHLKQRKAPLTKQQQQKLAQQKSAKERGQNIFIQKAHKKDEVFQRKKQNKRSAMGLPDVDNEEMDDDELLDNVADMLDGEDLEYLNMKKGRNRKRKHAVGEEADDDDIKHAVGLEKQFAHDTALEDASKKITVDLLPVKTREGEIITRSTQVDFKPKPKAKKAAAEEQVEGEQEEDGEEGEKGDEDDDDDTAEIEYEDSDDDVVNDEEDTNAIKKVAEKKMVSTTDLLIARQQEIERQKYRIGIICSGILEKPEDKMRNFNALFELMDETNKAGVPNLLTVRKVAIVSLTEIFKDILPEYRVGQVDTKMQTVRKATLERVTFENALLQHFKKFLQRLEKLTAAVNRKGHGRVTPQSVKMAEVAVQSMADLLMAHPYFNYVKNIAQLLVYMLNCNYPRMRETVHNCFRYVFANDKKMDMTLFIIRRINHLIKSKNNVVHLECITCLMALKIKNVNLDAEKENELKQKKLEAHRQRLLSLSKKERKRRKKLTELNKELDETRAEENKQTKHAKLTEIVKMLFTIYFRVLKNDPTSKVLSAILEGLAEFAHVINLDFFSDLIEVLNNILETQEDLGYREQLHCIKTIFVILSGQGEVLNIDPIRFYQHFYRNMLAVHAGKNHDDFRIILQTLDEVLVKRRRNMSQQRLMAFIKRLLMVGLNLLHHGTLATLGTIKTTFQLTSVLDILLDTDDSIGSGKYDPTLEDPEYCNASCTALYELTTLQRHYHPIVRKMATHIANGVPASGEGSLPSEIGKLTAMELFEQYDSTQMAFNPTIPVPRPCEPKIKKGQHDYLSPDFKTFYKQMLKNNQVRPTTIDSKSTTFDFYKDLKCK
ncbi:nucleolar complex protein 3 homolog [Musca domestica]|uniref:Nucleolar complex protein 3 homolog n=2 Tax=Musca domestica TaxID=7370 RepID=A0A1I8MSC9_MUSDO|nr:nucleolar complex protein 3 homolog [Musca domestica]